MNIDELQSQVQEWERINFGDRPAHWPLLGMFEELSELQDAISAHDHDEVRDGAADACVFMADFCNSLGLNFAAAFREATQLDSQRNGYLFKGLLPWQPLGKVAHHNLKLEQGIRGSRADHLAAMQGLLVPIIGGLLDVAHLHEFELEKAIAETWSTVRRRRWRCAQCGVKFDKPRMTMDENPEAKIFCSLDEKSCNSSTSRPA